jgi:hypothetical protein
VALAAPFGGTVVAVGVLGWEDADDAGEVSACLFRIRTRSSGWTNGP